MTRLLAFVIPVLFAACETPTKFVGEPMFPNGVTGCRMACQKEGLPMIGYVMSGEYSTSCVCGAPPGGAPGAADAAPTAGVIVQVQAAAAAAAAQQQQMMKQQQQQQQRNSSGRRY